MNRIVRPFLFATALAAAFHATLVAQAEIDVEQLRIPHEVFVLDNGLTLIVHEDHSVPIVAVNSWYHVGSKNEAPGRTGFAHLFEHFFFNGSENYPHGFREAMDDLGANNRNGTTNVDRTNFFEDVPVSALERTLYLEADRLGFLAGAISEEMLEQERGVVQNEKRQGENSPYGSVFSRAVKLLYPAAHPYSWPTIGSVEDLNAATMDDLRAWYRTFYTPNNVVLSLAGDITAERALELVEEYFAGIPPGPPVGQVEEWIPRLDRNVREEIEDRVPQARIYRFWHAPAWGDDELIHLELFAGILTGSKSAPLVRALVYESEVATEAVASTWDKEIASNLELAVTVQPGVEVSAAEREMDAVVERLLEEGPTQEALQRARTRLLADFVRGMERLGGFGGRSDILAESKTFGGSTDAYLKRLRVIASATPEQVLASARKWLAVPHLTLVVRPVPEFRAAESDLDRSVLPALGEAPDVTFPAVQRERLDNGLEVMLLERHSAPVVRMALVVDAGYASDADGQEGIAALAVGLLDDGTESRDAFQIVDELDALGAEVSTGNSLDLSFVRLNALKMNLERSVEIFSDVALNPSFPEDLVAVEKQRTLARIAQEKATPNATVVRLLPPLIYPANHPYATPFTGSGFEQTVSGVDRENLVQWHERWFTPGAATLVVTGDVSMRELLPIVRKSFGSWSGGAAPRKEIQTVGSETRGKVYLIDRPDAPQSVIAAAHLTLPGGDSRDLALEAVMRNFGGMSTSRLNRNLRLDKHWSYGTAGLVVGARGPRWFAVIAPVQTDKTEEAMVEVMQEIRGISGERPIEGEEYESLMRNMTLRLPGRFETLAALEAAAISLLNYGYPDSYYSDYSNRMRSLTERDMADVGRAFVKPDELVWLVVGDLDQIEAGVRELGFGEVVRIDTNGKLIPD